MRQILPGAIVCVAIAMASVGWAAAVAADAPAIIEFAGGPLQKIKLKEKNAVLYGANGKALYRVTQDYALKVSGNAMGTVWAYDQVRQRVRLTPLRQPEMWLSCDDLEPMSIACTTGISVEKDGRLKLYSLDAPKDDKVIKKTSSGPVGMLPGCPGDPRCPRL